MSFERRLFAAAIGAWLVLALLALVSGPSLGHDEAAYAIAARGGGPVWMYRSSGAVELARLGLALGGSEWALRLANALVSAGIVVATWGLARAAAGERVAAWAAAAIASCHPMTLHCAELMGDLPSAVCVVAGIAVVVGELARPDGPRWRLMAAAPAFAAGFYLRYGNVPVIALAGVAAGVLWWRSIVRRPLPVLATVVLLGLLVAPHVVASIETTGSALGVLRESAGVPRRAYFAEGLVEYLRWIPLFWYGGLVTPLLVIGLVAPLRRRPAIYLLIVGLGEIVALGLDSHARPRYIFVALVVLVVVGVERLLPVIERRRTWAFGVVVLAWLGSAIASVPLQLHLDRARRPLYDASLAIRADAAGAHCLVIARVITQPMWYSGCTGALLRDPAALEAPPPATRVYVISAPHAEANIDVIAATLHATATPLATPDADARVWRLVIR